MAKIRKRIGKKGVTWQIDYYDPEGKRVMKCFPLRKDAEAYLGKVVSAKKEGRYHDVFEVKKESQVTFNELVDRYVENFGSQRSFKTYKRHAVKVLQECFGEKKLSEITYLSLETFRNQRRATPLRSGKPRTVATVNRELAALKHMLNKAVEWGMIEVSPFKKGSRLTMRENNQRHRYLSEEEIKDLLNSCCPHLKPIVEVALHTGMRKGELLSLKWEQVRNGYIYLTKTKSDKSRQIMINDRVAQVFRELRAKNKWKSPYVFCGPDGKPLQDVKRSFAGACRRAGIEDCHFHDLRHTFASQLLMKGASLRAVQKLLGHAESRTTDRYAHLSQEHLLDSVNLLNDLPTGKDLVNIFPFPDAKCGAGMGI